MIKKLKIIAPQKQEKPRLAMERNGSWGGWWDKSQDDKWDGHDGGLFMQLSSHRWSAAANVPPWFHPASRPVVLTP